MRTPVPALLIILTTAAECLAGGPARIRVFGAEDMGPWPSPPKGEETRAAVALAASGAEDCGTPPKALAVVSGSFTAPGMNEKIFTVDVGRCGAETPSFGSRRLVLTRDGKPVASVESGGEALKRFDIDGDGRDEFLLSWGGCESGTCKRWADVARFGKGVEVVERLGVVYRSDCGNGGGVRIKDVVVRSAAGKPSFEEARIDKQCEPTSTSR